MSPRRRSKRRSNRSKQSPQPLEFWKVVPEPGPVAPIAPAADPTAVLRSLGRPPLAGQGDSADHYLRAVVRAAGIASGLAHEAGLLAELPDD